MADMVSKRINAKDARALSQNPVKLLNNFYKGIKDAAEHGETNAMFFLSTISGMGLATIVDDFTDAGYSVRFSQEKAENEEQYRADLLQFCEFIDTVRGIYLIVEW